MSEKGSWIFLSHSSNDIEIVRKIRNEFERLGHNPLAFHLKCLSADTREGKQELDNLIKREIKARDWFVYCDSPEAQKSDYVKEERDYIEYLKKEKVFAINIMTGEENILNQVRQISSQADQVVSFASNDQEIVKSLIQELEKKDYSVWTLEMGVGGEQQGFSDIFGKVSRSASYSVIISENSLKEPALKNELNDLASEGAEFIVIVLEETEIPNDIQEYIKHAKKKYDISGEEDFKLIVEEIDREVARKAALSRLNKYMQLFNEYNGNEES